MTSVTIRYTPKQLCAICEKREDTVSVVLDGQVVGLCDECWSRGTESSRVERDEEDDAD